MTSKRSGRSSTSTTRSAKRSSAGCKDCAAEGVTTKRKAIHPGPRCATHWRKVRTARRDAARAAHVARTYSITEEQYQALYAAQGGQCAGGCGATGRTKRLAVDHDHTCCSGPVSCGRCVRGLLCSRCNRFIGHLGDNPEALRGLASYLEDPPARRVLKLTSTREDKAA